MRIIGEAPKLAAAASALLLAAGVLAAGGTRAALAADVLFVGDGLDNNVETFDAGTGAFLKALPTGASGVVGPRGVLSKSGSLLLVNQNVDQPFNGEVDRFAAGTGSLLGKPVAGDRADAPFAPRGMILWKGDLFVANVIDAASGPGAVLKYTAAGEFVAALAPPPPAAFHPFGVVIGPDRRLYVSNRPDLGSALGGQVLRFDPATGKLVDTFVANDGTPGTDCTDQLNAPEGLVFGPDGRLYITSYRADDGDTDKILVFDGPAGPHPGACVGRIDLDQPGKPRSSAVALLFGPGGDLFVPITNAADEPGKDRGAVRPYKAGRRNPNKFTYFVTKGGPLGQGWYLTFKRTDPGTLAYRG